MSISARLETTICNLMVLGRLSYAEAVRLQESCSNEVANGSGRECFILLEHPHVITLGRGFHSENLLFTREWMNEQGVAVEESGRGGDVTYHGPGQIVGYPILNISDQPDLHLYLRNLEQLMIDCLSDFGITAERKPGKTGAWVDDEKVGAIGVRVAKWVTSHGFALNVNTDLKYFDWIVPCGIREYGVTSMQKLLRRDVPIAEVQGALVRHFERIFRRRLQMNP